MRLFVEAVGLCGPGLKGWTGSLSVLAGHEAYDPVPIIVPPCGLLPANERRRAPIIVKLALATGAEALNNAGRDAMDTPSIFASSGGDGDTIHEILSTLASPVRELSPTRFHNSVHNAAAGYWSIATGSRAASTSLCCYDDGFAAGLIEAGAQAVAGNQAVALIAYDAPYPAPLCDVRPLASAFGMALILAVEPSASAFASVDLALEPCASAATPANAPALEVLRRNTPAARSLPLLAALAGGRETVVTLDYLGDMTLKLHVAPFDGRGPR